MDIVKEHKKSISVIIVMVAIMAFIFNLYEGYIIKNDVKEVFYNNEPVIPVALDCSSWIDVLDFDENKLYFLGNVGESIEYGLFYINMEEFDQNDKLDAVLVAEKVHTNRVATILQDGEETEMADIEAMTDIKIKINQTGKVFDLDVSEYHNHGMWLMNMPLDNKVIYTIYEMISVDKNTLERTVSCGSLDMDTGETIEINVKHPMHPIMGLNKKNQLVLSYSDDRSLFSAAYNRGKTALYDFNTNEIIGEFDVDWINVNPNQEYVTKVQDNGKQLSLDIVEIATGNIKTVFRNKRNFYGGQVFWTSNNTINIMGNDPFIWGETSKVFFYDMETGKSNYKRIGSCFSSMSATLDGEIFIYQSEKMFWNLDGTKVYQMVSGNVIARVA